MDVSFIMSEDELFTLLSLAADHTEAGRRFAEAALAGAELCSLGGLADRKLARRVGSGGGSGAGVGSEGGGAGGSLGGGSGDGDNAGDLELSPVIRMIADAIAHADGLEDLGGAWVVRSPWVTLRCEKYPYQDRCLRIIPLKPPDTGGA